ncbi:hypothetical protein PBY51_022939 [Eleginops maclovinus]|uniref:MADF domain-containing protein n=1 Tax=Eleginops maclovinus TaxID=56733 RepID=A0AAN7XKU5_ELEMC|nr:hypothetical protein PBY51_022939 [Eleginops maclovinus]
MADGSEKIILAVSGHRVLYDLSAEGYRNINIKAMAWEDVARTAGKTVKEVKKRWRDLRDTYVKHRRAEQERQVSGAAASQKRPFKYAQIMSFLIPYVTPRRTTSNIPDPDPSDPSEESQERERVEGRSEEEEEEVVVEVEVEVEQDEDPHPAPPADEGPGGATPATPVVQSSPVVRQRGAVLSPWRKRRAVNTPVNTGASN